MKKEKTNYKARIICPNCRQATLVVIDKGIKIDDHITGKTCKNCGCKFKD